MSRCENWCSENGLGLNVNKSYKLSISRKRNVEDTVYQLSSQRITSVTHMRDLGVTFDSKLSFEQHIQDKLCKANKMLGFLMRTCTRFRKLKPLKTLYLTLVRPLLEYNSPVWSPFYNTHVRTLESVQNRFTRYVYRKFHYPYESSDVRNKRLELSSLLDRRNINDALTLHKIVHGSIDSDLTNNIFIKCNSRNTRNCETFRLQTARTNVGIKEPLYRMCNTYNTELSHIDIFTSFAEFKKKVSVHFSQSG